MASDSSDKQKLIVDTFSQFDADGDGVISRKELTKVLKLLGPDQFDDKSIDVLMAAADTNKNGKIEYKEFVAWVMQDDQKKGPIDKRGSFSVDYRVLLPERFEVEIRERYAMDKLQLGEGGYGKVFIARDKEFENRKVAVKRVTRTGSDAAPSEALQAEINIMKSLDHPSICKLLATFREDRHLYFVMELCEGGELFDKIIESGYISESFSATIISQITSALAYAHSRGIAHRDLKPENVVFVSKDPKNTHVKLIDWGLAAEFLDSPMTAAVGSFAYAAPEVILSRNKNVYSEKCDLWSLGVLTYVMLCGKPPFWGTRAQHLRHAKAESYPMKAGPWVTMNPNAKDFVKKLIKADPNKRMVMKDAATHAWLTEASTAPESGEVKQVLGNLTHFANSSTFVRMCITAVARQLDHKNLRGIHDVFKSMDTNGDGVLCLDEIKKGFASLFGEDSQEAKEAIHIFAGIDVDGSGIIDYTEFCAAGLCQKTASQDDVIWAAFKTFDRDNSGFIERRDLKGILDDADMQDAWSADVCKEVAQDIISMVDKDGDGKISFEDWKKLMRSCWDKKRSPIDDMVAPPEGDLTREPSKFGTSGLQAYDVLRAVSNLNDGKEADS